MSGSTGTTADVLKRGEIEACKAAEVAPTPLYVDAAALLPIMARRYVDADDVASVARVLLASIIDGRNLTDCGKAAAAATYRAADRLAEQRRRSGAEVAAGDTVALAAEDATVEARSTVARPSNVGTPDAAYRWTTRDAMATAASLLTAEQRRVLAAMYDGGAAIYDTRGAHGVSVTALASALAGKAVKRGRATAALTAALTDTLTAAQDALEAAAWQGHGIDCQSNVTAGQWARWDDRATSGPASAVVVTHKDGTHTVDGYAVDAATAGLHLSRLTVEPYVGGTLREETDATLAAPRVERPGQRVPGVSVDPSGAAVAPWGAARVGSGGGAAAQRPTVSRKRKRDGGIGSPMVPGV